MKECSCNRGKSGKLDQKRDCGLFMFYAIIFGGNVHFALAKVLFYDTLVDSQCGALKMARFITLFVDEVCSCSSIFISPKDKARLLYNGRTLSQEFSLLSLNYGKSFETMKEKPQSQLTLVAVNLLIMNDFDVELIPFGKIFGQIIRDPQMIAFVLPLLNQSNNETRKLILKQLNILVAAKVENSTQLYDCKSWQQTLLCMLFQSYNSIPHEVITHSLSISITKCIRKYSSLSYPDSEGSTRDLSDVYTPTTVEEWESSTPSELSSSKDDEKDIAYRELFVLQMNFLTMITSSGMIFKHMKNHYDEVLLFIRNITLQMNLYSKNPFEVNGVLRIYFFSLIKRIQSLSEVQLRISEGAVWISLEILIETILDFMFHFSEGRVKFFVNDVMEIPDMILIDEVLRILEPKIRSHMFDLSLNELKENIRLNDCFETLKAYSVIFGDLKVFMRHAMLEQSLEEDGFIELVERLSHSLRLVAKKCIEKSPSFLGVSKRHYHWKSQVEGLLVTISSTLREYHSSKGTHRAILSLKGKKFAFIEHALPLTPMIAVGGLKPDLLLNEMLGSKGQAKIEIVGPSSSPNILNSSIKMKLKLSMTSAIASIPSSISRKSTIPDSTCGQTSPPDPTRPRSHFKPAEVKKANDDSIIAFNMNNVNNELQQLLNARGRGRSRSLG